MENLKKFLNNLETLEKAKQIYAKNEENIRDVESNKMQKLTDGFEDDYKKYQDQLEENLKTITSFKHIIHKRQDLTQTEATGAPISNIHHETMINFVKETALLINKFGTRDMIKSSQLDRNVAEVVKAIVYNENLLRLVRKEKITVDDVEAAMKNIHTVIDYYQEIIKENAPLESSILDFD